MRRQFLATLLLALLASAGAPASAAQPPPADFLQLYDEYQRSGVIGGCSYREADLRSALTEIPADIEAYDPGFADSLNAALEQRAAGCGPVSSTSVRAAAGTIVAADGSPGPAIPRAQAPAPRGVDTSLPAPLIALVALVGFALLLGAALALTRRGDRLRALRRRVGL